MPTRRPILLLAAMLFSGVANAGEAPKKAVAAESSPAGPVDEKSLPAVVAKVNDVEIKRADLENAVETVKAQLSIVGQQVPVDRKDEMFRGLLDDLIATELLAQEAAARKLKVADAEVEEFVGQFKDRFPSDEVFKRALSEQGITEQQLRVDVRKQLGIKKLLDKEVLAKVSITPAAAEKFYKENTDQFVTPDEVRAAHVLVGVDKNADAKAREAARREAAGVLEDARAKKDFSLLAKAHSDDPGSKDKGGDLGFFRRGEMVPAFEQAAFTLNPNDISDVVETPYGFHVIKVLEKRAGGTLAYKEVEKEIVDFLKEKRAGEMAKTFVDGLRKKAKVQIFI